MNYAIVYQDKVVNMVVWDGDKENWQPPEGQLAVLVSDDSSVSIGWSYVEGTFYPPEVTPPTLDELKVAKTTEINNTALSKIIGGFTSKALGVAYTYPSMPADQTNLISSAMAAMYADDPDTWTTVLLCTDAQGVTDYVEHTVNQTQKVNADFLTMKNTIQVKKTALLKQITAATTIKQVTAIVW